MSWEIDAFVRSLGSAAPATVRAYRADVEAFADWAGRGVADGPEGVDRLLLRRYLAYLSTRGLAKRTIARKAASLRRYFAWAQRRGLVASDPARRLSAPSGEGRLPRVLSHDELAVMLDAAPPAPGPARAAPATGGRRAGDATRVTSAARRRGARAAVRLGAARQRVLRPRRRLRSTSRPAP